jgi:GT2 family glycosyltransferase
MNAALPSVSVIVPLLNEAAFFDSVIGSVLAQDYDGPIEFVLVDNGSTDGTRERLERLATDDPRVRVIDNPRRGIPISLNIGLRAAQNEIFVRMDAHSEYPADYVARGVEIVRSGRAEWVAGPAYARGQGEWSRWVAAALATRLGVGGSDFRSSAQEVYTDTAFGGVIARELLVELGGWDERWIVNEDAELATRARAAGARILLAPSMAASYIPRDDPRALAEQYWRYGVGRARTSVAHPQSMRPSHLLPPLVALALFSALLPTRKAVPARLAVLIYAAIVAVESARAARGNVSGAAKLAAIFPVMHLSWGVGNITGFARFGSPLPALQAVVLTLAARLQNRR